ncbi:N-acetylmuramoyl-L-alanine amidase [Pandoraea norimbergensis]|uniref:N-acetylmuramoyl-L-alanine amidase n=1 Tax=Pandoraea norimbergensis TaxID=93219 RepID=A0ABM5WFF1_9BURK|nr:N-acetylmuramoyl-L-alanine amidase [Pandoraea norimbergensis]
MLLLPLSACTTTGKTPAPHEPRKQPVPYRLDESVHSPNQTSRVRTLVLHYTELPLADSLATLIDPIRGVSAHYLVPAAAEESGQFRVYVLVPESQLARHAGVSYWQGDRPLNGTSIGIEIVNGGFPTEDRDLSPVKRQWETFDDEQIAVVGELAADIVARHRILPHKVVGHADVAPGRKVDPGPLFPWRTLYEQHGVGAWPDDDTVNHYRNTSPFDGDVAGLQAKLLAYGYDAPQSGELDAPTTDVISAFQMHFRPARYDGVPDAETLAILDALLEKYFHWPRTRPHPVQLA